ncbi:MAG: hypothetical protein ABW214_08275, partial [Terrimicrobiaceae bacterium]
LRVFVRSLRKAGCELPVLVIPCGDGGYELPPGCNWVGNSKLLRFLRQNSAHPLYCKYVTLLQSNSAYFDTDIIFLREPREWLQSAPSDSFVVADTEWAKNSWTYSDDSLRFLSSLSSCWPLFTFNSGFFAFENPLYEEDELIDVIQSPEYRGTCLERTTSPIDQPAMNWLVLRKQRKIFNFNLPEQYMESTMVVDYGTSSPESITSRSAAPAFLHFAGPRFQDDLPLNVLFTSFLTPSEKEQWDAQISERRVASRWLKKWPFFIRVLNRTVRVVDNRFHVQPKL